MRTKLLALDIDGTLLDREGRLPDASREAVAEARRRGLRVVLCTGRRLRTALPIAEALELREEIVVNNGVLVKHLGSRETLRHAYLPPDAVSDAVGLMREVGAPLVYVDDHPQDLDILVERASEPHPFQREYLDDQAPHTGVVDDLTDVPAPVVMVSLMADLEALAALHVRARSLFGPRLGTRTIGNSNYRGGILECVSPGSGKWSALAWLAARLDIAPEAIAAVGDDRNDTEMLARSGLGIAMGNAAEEARDAADHVVATNEADGLAEAVEHVLSRG